MQAYLIVARETAAEADALAVEAEHAPALARACPGAALLVRVAGPAAPDLSARLATVLPLRPRAILLPAASAGAVAELGARLAVHEAEAGLPDGTTGILALVTGARGLLEATRFADASPRLRGLGWDAAALAAELGVAPLDEGAWCPPLAQGRALVRLAAAAAGVPALEAACPEGGDVARLAAAAERDGFAAMLARDEAQVQVIRRIIRRPR